MALLSARSRTLLITSGAAALGVGLVVGWQAAVTLVTVGLLVWLGYECAGVKLSYDRARVRVQRQALEAEWRSLEQTDRVRSVFLAARRAMQREGQQVPDTESDERRP
ncbi:hypothetical protein [Actinokineospora sp. HUAS TT18]|uniref:hypothetical protein n=1 Tax=Actinokineospora sp. HUAS TT18 TaxID=3447451 RepID=UPI003F51B34C